MKTEAEVFAEQFTFASIRCEVWEQIGYWLTEYDKRRRVTESNINALIDETIARIDRYRAALEYIDGCFIEGKRKTYGSPDDTLDRIRESARAALSGERS